jgi:UDP-glucose 4-epimerase
MRVCVVGATGNVGTSVLAQLAEDPAVTSILGVARRRPGLEVPKTEWATADIGADELAPLFRGVDVVVHLAWQIQPSRDGERLRKTNVLGSERLFRAVGESEVRALVYASSVGAYSPGPKNRLVDETWPTAGISSSFYSRHKAAVERLLDEFEREHPEVRTVRLRPALIFKRDAGAAVRRLFAGPFLPNPLVKPGRIPFVPDTENLRVQAVHTDDVADAYRRAVVGEARGAFNVAAEPILEPGELARALDARLVPVPGSLLRGAASASWRLRLQPTPPGWVDLALQVPLLDSGRALRELGWAPRWSATAALLDLVEGIRENVGLDTPPLAPDKTGPLRAEELVTGVGSRERL